MKFFVCEKMFDHSELLPSFKMSFLYVIAFFVKLPTQRMRAGQLVDKYN